MFVRDESYLKKIDTAIKKNNERLNRIVNQAEREKKKIRFAKIVAAGKVVADAGLLDCSLDELYFHLVQNKNKILKIGSGKL